MRIYLQNQNINSSRLTAIRKGKASPVATNETPSGRPQNRRIDVIITDQ